jgi:[DsrC]-trisulfide reductase subunit J
MMYDAGKVLIGLVIFCVLFTSPVWYNLAVGEEIVQPDLGPAELYVKENGLENKCIDENMKADHMTILNRWRDEAIREGKRDLPDSDFKKSLSNTCLECHTYVSRSELVEIKKVASKKAGGDNKLFEKLMENGIAAKKGPRYEAFCKSCHNINNVTPFCWDCHLNFEEF